MTTKAQLDADERFLADVIGAIVRAELNGLSHDEIAGRLLTIAKNFRRRTPSP